MVLSREMRTHMVVQAHAPIIETIPDRMTQWEYFSIKMSTGRSFVSRLKASDFSYCVSFVD